MYDLEQERARPEVATQAYLLVISREPEAVMQAIERRKDEQSKASMPMPEPSL